MAAAAAILVLATLIIAATPAEAAEADSSVLKTLITAAPAASAAAAILILGTLITAAPAVTSFVETLIAAAPAATAEAVTPVLKNLMATIRAAMSNPLTAYASFSTSMMVLRTFKSEFIPEKLEAFVVQRFRSWFFPEVSYEDVVTFVIDDDWEDLERNDLLDAARVYLSTKIGSQNKRVRVGMFPNHRNATTALVQGEEIVDEFDGIEVTWRLVPKDAEHKDAGDYYELRFDTEQREKVLGQYIEHVMKDYEKIKQKEKVLKLYTRPSSSWRGRDLRHPTTFDTLAMDFDLKRRIVDDLDRFKARKELYERVGKAWKRGYLLYGPPGTGKSSMVAAMANHLNFDIYSLELGEIYSDNDLRSALLGVGNKSITVVEDIDCCYEVHDRSKGEGDGKKGKDGKRKKKSRHEKFTLSTLLNCIDGLWTSRAEERIVIFTTNHKEILDPALLRAGRMDMHINLSYCRPQAFSTLASNYLGIEGDHPMFPEIYKLLEEVDVTPAALAEELMKDEGCDAVLKLVVEFLKEKKAEKEENKGEETEVVKEKKEETEELKEKKDETEKLKEKEETEEVKEKKDETEKLKEKKEETEELKKKKEETEELKEKKAEETEELKEKKAETEGLKEKKAEETEEVKEKKKEETEELKEKKKKTEELKEKKEETEDGSSSDDDDEDDDDDDDDEDDDDDDDDGSSSSDDE